jgi:serine acetyltransferase
MGMQTDASFRVSWAHLNRALLNFLNSYRTSWFATINIWDKTEIGHRICFSETDFTVSPCCSDNSDTVKTEF